MKAASAISPTPRPFLNSQKLEPHLDPQRRLTYLPSSCTLGIEQAPRKGRTYMRTQSMDTSPEAERVQIELLRKASPAKRFALMEAWSQFLIDANRQNLRQQHPHASEEEIKLIFVANNYG